MTQVYQPSLHNFPWHSIPNTFRNFVENYVTLLLVSYKVMEQIKKVDKQWLNQ